MTGITKSLVSTLIAAVFILASVATVEAEDSFLCMDKVGTLAVSDQCNKYGEALNVQDLGDLLERQSDCGACSEDVSGKWRYRYHTVGYFSPERRIVFIQSGKRFKGINGPSTMVGSVEGNVLTFTIVVTGEELEGYVAKVIATIDGDRITGVMEDWEGQYKSFVARR